MTTDAVRGDTSLNAALVASRGMSPIYEGITEK